MRSITEEKGILDGVVNESLSKEMTFERPKRGKCGFCRKRVPGRGGNICKGPGGRSKLCLFGEQQEQQ